MGRRRRSKFHNRLQQERIEGVATLFPDEQENRYREETPNDIAMKERQEMQGKMGIRGTWYDPIKKIYTYTKQRGG